MQSVEARRDHSDYEPFLRPLPALLTFAQSWLNDRPSLQYQLQRKYSVDSERQSDYKYHFNVVYEYLSMAEQETQELVRALTAKDQAAELGDVLHLLLHFGNAASITSQDVRDRLASRPQSHLTHTNRNTIKQAVATLTSSVARDNHLLFGGPMSFEEGPWLSPRDSEEWHDYKKSIVDLWAPGYIHAVSYAMEHRIDLTSLINSTLRKASYNFPAPFFQPTKTPFIYNKYNYNARKFCRLLRSTGYLQEYHALFDNVRDDGHHLCQWTYDILHRIVAVSKNNHHRLAASMLLEDYAFNKNKLFYFS